MLSRDFRGAHAWLRGFSDGKGKKGNPNKPVAWPDYPSDYGRGWWIGRDSLRPRPSMSGQA